ncbi:hypothetical protein [Enterococcus rotai]|uniref:hypothetical protein n=1 Tax=Enterococcus rotai TaxID=118060 RepID=UPI0032B5935F
MSRVKQMVEDTLEDGKRYLKEIDIKGDEDDHDLVWIINCGLNHAFKDQIYNIEVVVNDQEMDQKEKDQLLLEISTFLRELRSSYNEAILQLNKKKTEIPEVKENNSRWNGFFHKK